MKGRQHYLRQNIGPAIAGSAGPVPLALNYLLDIIATHTPCAYMSVCVCVHVCLDSILVLIIFVI